MVLTLCCRAKRRNTFFVYKYEFVYVFYTPRLPLLIFDYVVLGYLVEFSSIVNVELLGSSRSAKVNNLVCDNCPLPIYAKNSSKISDLNRI